MSQSLLTTGEIAAALGLKADQVLRAVRRLGIEPIGQISNRGLYAPDTVDKVQAYLAEQGGWDKGLRTLGEMARVHGVPLARLERWRNEGRLQPRGSRGSHLVYVDEDVLALAQQEHRNLGRPCRLCVYCKASMGYCLQWSTWVDSEDTCGYWQEDRWRVVRRKAG